ncbi:hypothetical protein [Streptomyces sp. MZ04]|uniref:hypothetical protein n=1 Tax=Streptomyces sp. MZ04 TaxID=2559236 RepID=UPI00107EAF4C|nr:hypothetical protein [Streptomyces sp. MZ04]TGA90493.1 hypothetical protein E2651_38595 [Streptomyces sp. MZ04]
MAAAIAAVAQALTACQPPGDDDTLTLKDHTGETVQYAKNALTDSGIPGSNILVYDANDIDSLSAVIDQKGMNDWTVCYHKPKAGTAIDEPK